MAGVNRPMTLADVIGTINQQDTTADQSVSGIGEFAEVDETIAAADAAFITASTPTNWDQGQWGATQWQ